MKKCDSPDTRDFVPFTDFYKLSLENIKIAYKRHNRLPRNLSDVSANFRGPSCTRIEKIRMKKLFFVRFLENRERKVASPDKLISSTPGNFSVPVTLIPNIKAAKHVNPPSVFAQSVLDAALLKAGKLVKRKAQRNWFLNVLIYKVLNGKILRT